MRTTINRKRRIRPGEAMDARRELQAAFQAMREARANSDFYGDARNAYELLGATQCRLIAALAFLDAGPTGKDWDVRDRELRHQMAVADSVREARRNAAV